MDRRLTRRAMLGTAVAWSLTRPAGSDAAQEASLAWATAPIGWPGEVPGAGFGIGDGFACENTWFAPGWWHTGEDWYATEGDTAGAAVYAVANGEVAYAGFDYPGRVVIVRHVDDLYSMYGHLDPVLRVGERQMIAAGERLGDVLAQANVRGAGRAPSHLHFEIRSFLTRDEVNGASPQHGVNCGFQCPPGPGYWPIGAEHPAILGWRNPTHERLARLAAAAIPNLSAIANTGPASGTALLYPELDATATPETIAVEPGQAFPILEIAAGDPAGTGTSAEAYDAWLRVDAGNDATGWVQAAVPSDRETGSDGRPSALDVPWLIQPGA